MTVEQINDRLVSKLVNNELVILPFGDFQVSYFVTNWSFLGRILIGTLPISFRNWTYMCYISHMMAFGMLLMMGKVVFDKTQLWPKKSRFDVQILDISPDFVAQNFRTGKR